MEFICLLPKFGIPNFLDIGERLPCYIWICKKKYEY